MSKKKQPLMDPIQGSTENAIRDRLGLERLIFFSDAVFAIAITLLVLEIRLPAGLQSLGNSQLLARLLGEWHKYLGFLSSFIVIGSFWLAHHRKFRFIQRYDAGLLFLNLLLLMVIAFAPFPSAVISENSNRTATIFYALVMTLAGLLLALLWHHASRRNRLLDPDFDPRKRRRQMAAPLLTAGIFALSVGVAFLQADVAKAMWALILPVSIYANRD